MGEQIRIIRRPEQLSTGRTDSEIRQACASGIWSRIHRGAYVPSDHLSRLDAYGLHRLRVEAVAGTASAHAAVSHISAAVVHGFELWNTPLEVVHLSRDRRGGGRKSARRHVHSVSFTDDEVTHVDGLRVTTLKTNCCGSREDAPFRTGSRGGQFSIAPFSVDQRCSCGLACTQPEPSAPSTCAPRAHRDGLPHRKRR